MTKRLDDRMAEGVVDTLGAFFGGIGYLWNTLTSPSRIHSKKASLAPPSHELQSLYNEVEAIYELKDALPPAGLARFVIEQAQDQSGRTFPASFIEPIFDLTLDLAQREGLFGIGSIEMNGLSLSEQIELKRILGQYRERYQDYDVVMGTWLETLIKALEVLLKALPQIKDDQSDGTVFQSSILQLLDKPQETLQHFIECFFNPYSRELLLYTKERNQFEINAFELAGIDPYDSKGRKPPLPKDSTLAIEQIVQGYFKYTPFVSLFSLDYEFHLKTDARFEHTHILAGTGHGKTQLLQKLQLSDLKDGHGFMVIDSQGDMIKKIRSLDIFNPETGNHKNKLIVIDPEDVEFPPCLNMFDLGFSSNISSLEKERQINKTVDLYTYMFGALFGSELTAKQGVIFRYIARLIFEIPNATVQTLRELLTEGEKYQQYMNQLDGSAKAFFKTEFFSSSFASTKKQVLSRLWAVLSNSTLEKMFSATSNKVNVFDAMNNGSIILVNTTKDLLGTEGSAVMGRFFIALASQSVIRRASIPEKQRKPFFMYIDESQEYVDEKLEEMLTQARKYCVGFNFAHQALVQLGELKTSVLTNTTVKIAGGMSYADSKAMALEMKTSTETLTGLTKTKTYSQFGCYVKNQTSTALPIKIEFGLMEKQPKLSAKHQKILLEQNREKYCTPASEIVFGEVVDIGVSKAKKSPEKAQEEPETVEVETTQPIAEKPSEPEVEEDTSPEEQPVAKEEGPKTTPKILDVKPEGRGGKHHQYLQKRIKRIGQEKNFHSTIESPVLDGKGAIDIALRGFNRKIAVEVSITTGAKWEFSNIRKCLKARYDHVVLVSDEKEHLEKLTEAIGKEFKKEVKKGIVRTATLEQLVGFLDEVSIKGSSQQNTVAGYQVTTNFVPSSPEEQDEISDAIAKIMLGL